MQIIPFPFAVFSSPSTSPGPRWAQKPVGDMRTVYVFLCLRFTRESAGDQGLACHPRPPQLGTWLSPTFTGPWLVLLLPTSPPKREGIKVAEEPLSNGITGSKFTFTSRNQLHIQKGAGIWHRPQAVVYVHSPCRLFFLQCRPSVRTRVWGTGWGKREREPLQGIPKPCLKVCSQPRPLPLTHLAPGPPVSNA